MTDFDLVHVTPDNVDSETLFCVRDITSPAFLKKKQWFLLRFAEGLRLLIFKNREGKPAAYIEYIPIEKAWRPVDGTNFLFIHCMFVYSNKDKSRGVGSALLKSCEDDALSNGFDGICTMTSNGSWMADKRLFERNGFIKAASHGRFDLMVKKFNPEACDPQLLDWTSRQQRYEGWHILYADQCPWHEKSVKAMVSAASRRGINLEVTRITSSEEAKSAPSGFGVFSLIKDGKLLEDHYISETRFNTILNKELRQI